MIKLRAAKKEAGRAYGLVETGLPKAEQKMTPAQVIENDVWPTSADREKHWKAE